MPMTPAIDPLLLQAIGGIISMRLRSTLAAEKRLAVEVDAVGSEPGKRSLDHETLWDAVFSVLDHSAALSRMFWPPYLPPNPTKDTPEQRVKRDRGEQLRLWLDITDDSLFNEVGRHPRNTIEHWGENCADWYQQMAGRRIFNSHVTDAAPTGDDFYLRSYNYVTATVTYGDATVELRPLLREAAEVLQRFGWAMAYATTYPYIHDGPRFTQKEPLR